ncbi:multifunctional methyltransferase subunit TRM112-like protein [Crassostrea virginica]
MKLLTHNFLTSNIIKGVKNGYPLSIMPGKVETKEVDFNPEFITRMLPKIDWVTLQKAAKECGFGEGLPDAVQEEQMADQELLKKIHKALLEIEVIEGKLVCPESGREFPISNGIPNMLLNEDEV